MDAEKKRNIMIAVAVCCLLVAAGIFYFTSSGSDGGGGGSRGTLYLLCVNEKCKHQFEMSTGEYTDKIREMGPDAMMMGPMMGPMPIECPECHEKSAYIAEKCSACGTYFIPNYMNNKDYPDRCPSCGHSDIEERAKQYKQE